MANTNRTVISAGAGAALSALVVTQTMPIIDQWEGNVPIPYKDIAGILTVCRGHTGLDVTVKGVYDTAKCDELTKKDINIAIQGVLKYSPHMLWHPMQLVSAVSFSYNVGVGTYGQSSVARLFNAGDFQGGCSAMKLYNKARIKGVLTVSQGLVNRRQFEYEVCTSTLTLKEFNLIKK